MATRKMRSSQLIDFDRADVITPMIYPPRPTLLVSGTKPDAAMAVNLVPLAYIRQPEYWGIEVVGTTTGVSDPSGAVPYSVELVLQGCTGTVGVEVVGDTHTERIPLVPEGATEFVGAVEDGRFRPVYPSWVDDPYLRLTTSGAKDPAGPDAGELDLSRYEGSILRVLGHHHDGWIHSATVAEQVRDSVLSIVARQVLPGRARERRA